jgi:ATP-dependent Clp protease ATP-binding subunit ClpA
MTSLQIQSMSPNLWNSLSPLDLRKDISHFFNRISLNLAPQKIDACAQVLSSEKLKEAFGIDALQLAQELLSTAKTYLEATKRASPSTIEKLITAIVDIQVAIADSLISTFGVTSLFAPADNPMIGEFKIHRLTTLISTVTLLTSVVLPFIGEAIAGYIMAGIGLALAGLSLIYPYFKPMPSQLPSEGENLTKQLMDGTRKAVMVREDYLNKIVDSFLNTKRPQHAMLLGDYGVGKTEVAIALAQSILDGKYPELAGCHVFYFNVSTLLGPQTPWVTTNKLTEIIDALGRHRDNSIVVFDEIHVLCGKGKSEAGVQLLSLLDNKNGKGIKRCVGITTQEQINDIETTNFGLSDRFEKILVENATEEETVAILDVEYMNRSARPFLSEDAMNVIYKKTIDRVQPGSSLKILSKCFKQLSAEQLQPLVAEIAKVKGRIRADQTKQVVGHLNGKKRKVTSNREALKKELLELEEQLKIKTESLHSFYDTKRVLEDLTTSMFDTVVKIESLKEERLLSKLVLLDRFIHLRVEPLLEQAKRDLKKLGIKVEINSELIDEVLAQEKALHDAQKGAKNKGKNDRKVRLTS